MTRRPRYHRDDPDPLVSELERSRERLRYSQRRMASALGVPFRSYQKWLYTTRRPRDPESLLTRARELCSSTRANCWEVLSCGRGPDADDPRCPAATDRAADGVNGGRNAGRICWAIAGTLCEGRPEGAKARGLASCLGCTFFRRVLEEEGLYSFRLLKPGQTYTEHG